MCGVLSGPLCLLLIAKDLVTARVALRISTSEQGAFPPLVARNLTSPHVSTFSDRFWRRNRREVGTCCLPVN